MKRKKKTTTTRSKIPAARTKVSRAARQTLSAFEDRDPKAVTPGALQRSFHARQRASSKPRPKGGAFPIVAIGASAGGVESFSQFLKLLPPDAGMAYVLIQHLAPEPESLLPEILARTTEMPVLQAEDDMVVRPNHVYVIPPNADMGIQFGVLKLMPRAPAPVRHMPVDFFLRCLADDQSRFAIAVILSGADGDGAMGLRAIQEQGGLTFVQDPSTAIVNGMPNSAIAAGGIDRVAPIAEIVNEIIAVSKQPFAIVSSHVLGDDDGHLAELFRRLQRSYGVNFSKYKRSTIERRLRRRMLLLKVSSLEDYLELLAVTPNEMNQLYRDFLIGTTSFFRDADVFDTFKQSVLPDLLKARGPDEPLRLWIAGCSSGEEVYSVAICVLEVQETLGVRCPIQIFASDINEDALKKARDGIYPDSIATDVSDLRLNRFFSKVPGGYKVNSSLRDLCIFTRHNVTSDPPFSRMHGVFCRNLLIYFDSSFQRNVIKLFIYALNPGGSLILGTAEIPGPSDFLDPIDGRRRIYRRTNLGTRHHFDVPLAPAFPTTAGTRGIPQMLESGHSPLDRMVNRILIERFAPAGVVVDANMHIIQFRGGTSEFLEGSPGDASFNVFKMAKPGLDAELRVLLKKVESSGLPRRNDQVVMREKRSRKQVSLEVIPVRTTGEATHYLILFSRPAKARAAREPRGPDSGKKSTGERRLERELTSIKEHLQSIIREQEYTNNELQTANEEVLSSNEELQSTNEELQTAKEELQSTNEELSTVNDELLDRNGQLQGFTNDLTNLLASVNLPIVMVDPKFNIRRYTAGAERLFNIIETDVGRPISQLRPNLDLPDFNALIRASIESARTTEMEVRDRAGHRYSLRIRPYHTAEGRTEGAVIMLIDLGTLGTGSGAAPAGDERNLVDAFLPPTVLLDSDFRIVQGNAAFDEFTSLSQNAISGRPFTDLLDGKPITSVLSASLKSALDGIGSVSEISGSWKLPGGATTHLTFEVRRIQTRGSAQLLVIFDLDPPR